MREGERAEFPKTPQEGPPELRRHFAQDAGLRNAGLRNERLRNATPARVGGGVSTQHSQINKHQKRDGKFQVCACNWGRRVFTLPSSPFSSVPLPLPSFLPFPSPPILLPLPSSLPLSLLLHLLLPWRVRGKEESKRERGE